MKIFNPVNRQYVDRVDLGVLGSTFNTLEQGHKETIKAASELEIAMAQLDLNEAESEWRQGRIAEIRQTISDNSRYGNAYAAYDDIITKSGNLASDPGMLGRLNAQKEFKTFQDQLTNRSDIGESTKEMFREKNPYHYADRTNPETGEVIGGTTWTPNSRPVSTIDMYKLMSMALGNAAKDAGSSEGVTFLDANGNATSDYRKSADGAMHMKTGMSYQRLSEDKIKQAINAAMNATPGARESLQQDYDVANWSYNKNPTDENGSPRIVPGFTDNNGNKLSFTNFVNEQVIPFAKSASYYHLNTSLQVGDAMANRRKAQAASAEVAGKKENTDKVASILQGATNIGVIETEVDNYTQQIEGKQSSNREGLNIINNLTPNIGRKYETMSNFIQDMRKRPNVNGPGGAINEYIKDLRSAGINIDDQTRNKLYNAAHSYVQYDSASKAIEAPLNNHNKGLLRFSNSVATRNYKAGNSKSDDQIVNTNNKLWENNDSIQISLSKTLNEVLLKNNGQDFLRNYGINLTSNDRGDTVLNFNESDRNILPEIMSAIDKADKARGASWRGIGNMFNRGYNKDYVIDGFKNGKSTRGAPNNIGSDLYFNPVTDNRTSDFMSGLWSGTQRTINYLTVGNYARLTNTGEYDNNSFNVRNLGEIYDNGVRGAAKVQSKAGVNKGVMSVQTTNKDSWREAELQYDYNNGQIKGPEYNAGSKMAKANLDNAFASASFDAGLLYDGTSGDRFKKVSEPFDMKSLVSYMYTNHPNNVRRSAVNMQGVVNTRGPQGSPIAGYTLDFTVPNNAEGAAKRFRGKNFKLLYGGGISEDNASSPSTSIGAISDNIFNTASATNTPAQVIPYNNSFGNTDVSRNSKGNYNVNYGGKTIETDAYSAAQYVKNMVAIDQIADRVLLGYYNDVDQNGNRTFSETKAQILNRDLSEISQNVSSIIGKDPETIINQIGNYITTRNNERY